MVGGVFAVALRSSLVMACGVSCPEAWGILVAFPDWAFPGGSAGKESACNAGDPVSIPGSGRSSGGGNGNSLQSCGLENPIDRGGLAGYSPWGL